MEKKAVTTFNVPYEYFDGSEECFYCDNSDFAYADLEMPLSYKRYSRPRINDRRMWKKFKL